MELTGPICPHPYTFHPALRGITTLTMLIMDTTSAKEVLLLVALVILFVVIRKSLSYEHMFLEVLPELP